MGLTAHGLYSLKLHAFKFEEKLLCGKAAAIACKASVATYDAVAGSENRMEFEPLAVPTALTAFGLPIISAIQP